MIPPLDIFKKERDGTLNWKGTAENLEVAKLSVKVLAATSPGDYEIVHQGSGERIVITFDDRGMEETIMVCPRHKTFMVPHVEPLRAERPQGTITLRCANLDCSIVYVSGAFGGLYILEANGNLKPYLK